MSDEDKLKYLQSLASVRDRSQQIFDKVKEGASQNWSLDLSKLPAVVDFITELITRDYTDPKDIPPHTRWRHIDCGGVKRVVDLLDDFEQQHVPKDEQIRRIIDLFVVSVLLDAGAGSQWKYQDTNGQTYTRSEGLAIASFNMFTKGAFSSSTKTPCRVDAKGLLGVSLEQLAEAFQHNPQTNKLEGLEGRWTLLNRLAFAMNAHPEYFKPVDGKEARPGYLYDYLFKHPDVKLDYQNRHVVHINLLWDIIVHGLGSVWPESRTKFNGISLGDVWPADLLKVEGQNEDESLVTFHKLSQWLTYSLLEPLESLGGLCFEGKSLMTGLPEYRNGGLFVDLGVLTLSDAAKERGFAHGANLKANDQDTPIFEVYDQVIVEWRAITVILLDMVAKKVPGKFNLTSIDMPLANVLEGGSWKAGREIAAKLRPKTRGPPVQISSDGTIWDKVSEGVRFVCDMTLEHPNKPKVLVTGGTGFLGRAIMKKFMKEQIPVIGTGFSRGGKNIVKVNIMEDDQLAELVRKERFDVIIHSAAERRPDKAEKEPEHLRKLNVDTTRRISELAKETGALLILISTDAVFDGANPPFKEDSPKNPLNLYGVSKSDSEDVSKTSYEKRVVLRVPLLYGEVEYLDEASVSQVMKLVLETKKRVAERPTVNVDNVTKRHPTNVNDVANVLFLLVQKHLETPELIEGKIFHCSSSQMFTKYALALMMVDALKQNDKETAAIWEEVKSCFKPQNELPNDGVLRPINPKLDSSALMKLLNKSDLWKDTREEISVLVPQWHRL